MAKLTRRDILGEIAKVEQELVTLEEERGGFQVFVSPGARAELDSKVAALVRIRDSLIRQVTMVDQAKFNARQVSINFLLLFATAASALFAGLTYLRPIGAPPTARQAPPEVVSTPGSPPSRMMAPQTVPAATQSARP